MWPSAAAFHAEMEHSMGAAFPEAAGIKLAHAWLKTRRLAVAQTQQLALSLVAARRSSIADAAPRAVVPAEPPSTSVPVKVRKLLPTGLPVSGPALLTAAAATDPWVKQDALKAAKLDQLFKIVLEDVVDLQELGLSWDKLSDPVQMQGFKETLMAAAGRLSGARLGALIAAFKRWRRYCTERTVDVRRPTPLQVAEFLQSVAAGGPTAAASMHACLKWYAVTFGAAFNLDHYLTRPFRFHSVTHSGKQAPELEPWEFVNLCILTSRATGSHKVLLSIMVMAAVSCIRFEHLQRSKFEEQHQPPWLEFLCSQGKARKKGARPSYAWGMPQLMMKGQSLVATLADFYKHELPPNGFLIPALHLDAEDLWEITECTAFITNKAMTRSRFLEIFRGTLMTLGTDTEKARASTYNRLRRFLPTLANVLQVSDLELQAVGNWVELPQGGGGDPQRQQKRAVVSMGIHYAAAKVLRSVQVKQRCLDRFLELFRHKSAELSLTPQGLLCRDAWGWPEVATLHELLPDKGTPVPLQLDELQKPDVEVEDPNMVPAPPDDGSSGASDSDSNSPSSASDATAEGADLVGILPDPTAAEEVAWFRQARKLHIVREEGEDGRAVPWCRDVAFPQDPVACGFGFTMVDRSDACQRCLSRLPRGLFLALAEHSQWAY